ncbi:hypothetical protein B7P43_G15290 [Cryptotermes secundus]|uniref:Reverse transcriptase domain-containing protein n=1 Tax=Cryptotermes secundus TaxID=105785 RepID=A0A2J7RM69_9NEOP|nr:hypothetical protein B7P43_G15290 [Cryptotermes secundus]
MEKLQIDLNRLGEWVAENVIIINPIKSKAVCFTRARVMEPLNYREGQINVLDHVQKKAAKFAHRNHLNWGTVTQCRQIARICTLFKAYTGEQAWKTIGDRLQRPCYLSRGDHDKKIRSRKQWTDIGKYSFVNRTIQIWNKLPSHALKTLSCKPSNFRKRSRKVIYEVT